MVFAYLITEKISQVYEVQRLGDIFYHDSSEKNEISWSS